MCLGIPMQIVEIQGDVGYVQSGGVKRKVGLMLIEDAKVGDWVIVHAGFAIEKVKEDEAIRTLELISEGARGMSQNGSDGDEGRS